MQPGIHHITLNMCGLQPRDEFQLHSVTLLPVAPGALSQASASSMPASQMEQVQRLLQMHSLQGNAAAQQTDDAQEQFLSALVAAMSKVLLYPFCSLSSFVLAVHAIRGLMQGLRGSDAALQGTAGRQQQEVARMPERAGWQILEPATRCGRQAVPPAATAPEDSTAGMSDPHQMLKGYVDKRLADIEASLMQHVDARLAALEQNLCQKWEASGKEGFSSNAHS